MEFVFLIVLGAVLLAGGVGYWWLRRSLPVVQGSLRLPGLREPVQILRDRWGVPHIYAQNEHDLYFAQGFVHAQDRLWQMELNRRLGQGRLAELFGTIALPIDRMQRILGMARLAEHEAADLDPPTLVLLASYAAGVNAHLAAAEGRLPPEFGLLGFRPEQWRPADSLLWAKMMTWGLSCNWVSEMIQALLVARLGPDKAAELSDDYPADHPYVLPGQSLQEFLGRLRQEFERSLEWLPIQVPQGGSNAWVVDASRTHSGKPLLANDPHLSIQMPALWYEVHLECKTIRVAGVSLPGSPGVVIGHNEHIAWGLTASIPDTQDLYIEKFDPADPTRYEFQGEWRAAKCVVETIRVRGLKEPVTVQVRITRHGPIINDLVPMLPPNVPPLALRWVGAEKNHVVRAVQQLNRARNWEEFRSALSDWSMPAQNVLFADRAGNIGYAYVGLVPIRAQGLGQVPAPGWTGTHEWTGFIPFDELPHAFNPPDHQFVSANNPTVGREYQHFLSREMLSGFRARRIRALLNESFRVTLDDFVLMQRDLTSEPARAFCTFVLSVASEVMAAAETRHREEIGRVFKHWENWHYLLLPDSIPAALYELASHFACRRLFEPWLGPLTRYYLGHGFDPVLSPTSIPYLERTPSVMLRLLRENRTEWFRDETRQPTSRGAILAGAIMDAMACLRQRIGPEPGAWTWGRLHQAHFVHPLGRSRWLGSLFNLGPYPLGGDVSTVAQASMLQNWPADPRLCFIPSWRQVFDLADWDASRGVLTTGQSGHPLSPHYADQVKLWLAGETHPMPWTRARVVAETLAELWLHPG
jgi:penicillin amidase